MKWGRVGDWWGMTGDTGQPLIVVYTKDEQDGNWVVAWFDLPDRAEHIPMTEKGELELREYLQMKYLLLKEQ